MTMECIARVLLICSERGETCVSIDGPDCSSIIPGCTNCSARGEQVYCTKCFYGLKLGDQGLNCISKSYILLEGFMLSSVGGPGCSDAIPGCKSCNAEGDKVMCSNCMDGLQLSEDKRNCTSKIQ